MATNDIYPFGMDWYEDNRISSWPALVQWEKKIQFAYFRLAIGINPDNLANLEACHANTAWALGGYYELWFPFVPKDSQLKTLRDQLAKAPYLTLPVSLAFEGQAYKDAKGNIIRGWPSVGDLKYIAGKLIEAGYRVNIYTSLSGLDIIKASGLIDMKTADWWIARSYAFPMWSTEMDIAATLTLLQQKYGIQPDHVQFFQTVLDHGNSPIGSGQDFDRAVSWKFDEEEPPVEPPPPSGLQALAITVRSDRAELVSAVADGVDVTARASLAVRPFPVEPPPPPPPPPPPSGNVYRILKDNELPASYGWNGKSRTADPAWRQKYIDQGKTPPNMTPATVKLNGDDPVTKFPLAAVKVVHLLNDPHNAFVYVTRESAGWSNRGQTWPEKMEPIAFEDQLVDVKRVEGNRAYIRTWNGETDDPCVIHRWLNIDVNSVMHDAQNNVTEGPGYIVLAYPGEYWIEFDRLVKV